MKLTKTIGIFALLFFATKASAANDNSVTIVLRGFLNKIFKEGLNVGDVELGSEGNSLKDVKISFENPVIKELSKMLSFGVKLELNLGSVNISGKYHLKNFIIPQLFPVFGNGIFSIKLDNLNFKLHFTAIKNWDKKKFLINVNELNFISEMSTVFFENLMGDKDLSSFLNELISGVFPSFVETIMKISNMKEIVGSIIEILYNKILNYADNEPDLKNL